MDNAEQMYKQLTPENQRLVDEFITLLDRLTPAQLVGLYAMCAVDTGAMLPEGEATSETFDYLRLFHDTQIRGTAERAAALLRGDPE